MNSLNSQKALLRTGVTGLLLFALTILAREGTPPRSRTGPAQPLATVPQLAVTPTDPAAELAADARAGQTPLRYAVPEEVQVTDNLPISDQDKKKLYQTNAERVFGLDT